MTDSVVIVARGAKNGPGTKVKTGCATCRIRKVKCDETKPSCHKCIKTGRNCDGYDSPFRNVTSQPVKAARPLGGIRMGVNSQLIRPSSSVIAPEDIELLNRYFSIKTLLNVKLGCHEEARQLLEASLTDAPLRHAVLCLKALREDLETYGQGSTAVVPQALSYGYGLQQYNKALGGLASNLASTGFHGLKSALLCCQIFISIEQVLGNYSAMAQHIIRGLGIMHEHRARPCLVAGNKLMPAYSGQLPLLDVFIIKLYSAPCKFVNPPATSDVVSGSSTEHSTSPLQRHAQSRAIAPDMRTELTRIALSTLEFLDQVSRVTSAATALRLRSEKAALLDWLETWLENFERVKAETGDSTEPISASFLRLFHQILSIVVLGALDSSPDLSAELRAESAKLQIIANTVGVRVKGYRLGSGTSSSRVDPSKAR